MSHSYNKKEISRNSTIDSWIGYYKKNIKEQEIYR